MAKAYTGRHFVSQLHVGVIIAHGKQVVLAGFEPQSVVPCLFMINLTQKQQANVGSALTRPSRIPGSDGHHAAKYLGIVRRQLIGPNAHERSCVGLVERGTVQMMMAMAPLTVFFIRFLNSVGLLAYERLSHHPIFRESGPTRSWYVRQTVPGTHPAPKKQYYRESNNSCGNIRSREPAEHGP